MLSSLKTEKREAMFREDIIWTRDYVLEVATYAIRKVIFYNSSRCESCESQCGCEPSCKNPHEETVENADNQANNIVAGEMVTKYRISRSSTCTRWYGNFNTLFAARVFAETLYGKPLKHHIP
jgi:hypothetical protein